MSSSNKTLTALLWKFLERFGVQAAQFVVQLVLARLLSPDHYGVLAIMIIFVNLATVFVQSGFNTALIQAKDIDDDDCSSVFWVSLLIAAVLYIVLFFSAPLIGAFYNMPLIVKPLRVIALMLFPGALNSIQFAKVSRELDFKKVFLSHFIGAVVSGGVGIGIALLGGELWALVVQTILNTCVSCIVMLFAVKWFPTFVCKLSRVKVLFAFGWKLLVSALIDTLYKDIQGLVIGKKYDSATLGFYNKGKQFPSLIMSAVNGAVQSVMLPVMSKQQDSKDQVRAITRRAISMSSYVMFPLMAGLAAIAAPLIELLLTEKWLPAAPYLQIYCFSYAFWPVHTSNLQAINAMGRSDLYLKLEIIKKSYGLIALIIAVAFFDSPIAIAATGIVTAFLGLIVNSWPNRKLLDYPLLDQVKDILPSLLLSLFMFGAVIALGQLLPLAPIVEIPILVVAGAALYIVTSLVFRIKAFNQVLDVIKGLFTKKSLDVK